MMSMTQMTLKKTMLPPIVAKLTGIVCPEALRDRTMVSLSTLRRTHERTAHNNPIRPLVVVSYTSAQILTETVVTHDSEGPVSLRA